MADNNIFARYINGFFRKILSVSENKSLDIGNPERIIIIRQHNQLGDLLAGVSLFRAIKETYPGCSVTLIVSPFNYPGLIKNKYIDRMFVFDKKKLYNPFYIIKFLRLIREDYDAAIVPVVVSISFTSNLIARLCKARVRIGPASLDGRTNASAYFFDRRVHLNWGMHPDSNVSERSLDITRPFGINTGNFRAEISFDDEDLKIAEQFIDKMNVEKGELLVGLHVGAGKPQNRWSLDKYAALIKKLNENYKIKFYLTGSGADRDEINYVRNKIDFEPGLFINRQIPEVAALISKSDLFISNDTGIMHVAGTTETQQITLFGPTNPFNWAPIGENKLFIRKSDLIDDISVQDVLDLCESVLKKSKKENELAE